jgi:hypothetical protein
MARKMITEATCLDCNEMFIVDEDTEGYEKGTPEHEKCQGFNTRIDGSWYSE